MNRREFLGVGLGFLGAAAVGAEASGRKAFAKKPFSQGIHGRLYVPTEGVDPTLRVAVIGDAHCAFRDARDDRYKENYRRMSSVPDPWKLTNALKAAKRNKADLVLLVGDIISFPSYANVEEVCRMIREADVDCYYVAGNHDWRFEKLPCEDPVAYRRQWINDRLLPFYKGADPECSSRVVKGMRFVAIDDSTISVTEKQLAFWRQEIAKGDPTVLLMHVPIYVPGWSPSPTACLRWEESPTYRGKIDPVTRTFCEEVMRAENLSCVFTGHEHWPMYSSYRGQRLFSVDGNGRTGEYFDVSFSDPER